MQDGLFEGIAETGGVEIEIGGGFAFVAVAAEKFFVGRIVFEIAEAGDVDADGLVGAGEGFLVAEFGEIAAAAAAADVGGEVVAERAAGIGEAGGMLARAGVEEDARGFLRLGAEDYGAGGEFVRFFCDAVDVEEAAGAIGGGVHEDFVDHGVGDEFAFAGFERVGNGGEGGVEIGVRDATAFTGAAVMARAAAVDGLCEICGAGERDGATEFCFNAFAENYFLARERHGRLELAVGQVLEAFGHAGDADVFFDDVVVRSDVGVADGPVFAVAVVRGGFEILIAEAEADAAPDVGAAAGHAEAAHPVEGLVGGRGVGLVVIVDEPVLRVFVADVELPLDGVFFCDDGVRHVAVFELEGGFVLGEVFVGLRATGFDDGDV